MKIFLTKEEVIQSTILYLKSKNLISPDLDFTGKIEEYSKDRFLEITEFKPAVAVADEEGDK